MFTYEQQIVVPLVIPQEYPLLRVVGCEVRCAVVPLRAARRGGL